MSSLRVRGFVAIACAVLGAVGVTLVIAVVLVRRSVEQDALHSLARQAELVDAQQATAAEQTHSRLGLFFSTQQERLSILSLSQAVLLLPPAAGSSLRAGLAVQGSVSVGGADYLFAAQPVNGRAIVLLRSAKLAAADLAPFRLAFGIAAAVGALLAAVAAFGLARHVARPIERVSRASLALARGERPGLIPVEGSREVATLADSFNRMTADLDRARESERAFLLSVSHELKTPLAAIRGHGEALLDGVMTIPRAAGVIVSESKRLERLVRDLLDLGRLNQQTFTVKPEDVDLAALAAEAVARHEAEAVRVGVSLQAEAEPAPSFADPDRTLQVLSNLIENALRSTPSGGSVTVRATPGLLVVSDTGPGLAAEELPRAFERFYLYRRHGAHSGVGTGLGLAIVKQLSEAMDGTVRVESTIGGGSAFFVTLPTTGSAEPERGRRRRRAVVV